MWIFKRKSWHSGSPGLLKGAKGTTYEGGLRVPFIARYPDKLPRGGICREVATIMDVFATFLSLANIPLPYGRVIDGKNMLPLLQGKGESQHESFFYFSGDRLMAVRSKQYKLHFYVCTENWDWIECKPPRLYDVEADPSEKYDLAAGRPEIVHQLMKIAKAFEREVVQ